MYTIHAHLRIETSDWGPDGADPDSTLLRYTEAAEFSADTLEEAVEAMQGWAACYGPAWSAYEEFEDDGIEPHERRWDACRVEDEHGYEDPTGRFLSDYTVTAALYKSQVQAWEDVK